MTITGTLPLGITALSCPACGAPLEHHVDRVEVPVYAYMTVSRMKVTVEPFLACTGCEWAETVADVLVH